MSYQRRGKNAQQIVILATTQITDGRGNKHYTLDDQVEPIELTAAVIPERSARAEVPGQMEIDVNRIITDADISGVNLWSRVRWKGQEWDVVSPPSYHHGTRHTRHWSIVIRKRP